MSIKGIVRVFCDGDSSIPLIGFDKSHRDFLEAHMDTELSISIKNFKFPSIKPQKVTASS